MTAALILIDSPVCGLRPSRAARFFFVKVPKPGTVSLPSFFTDLRISSKAVSNTAATAFLVRPSGMFLEFAMVSISSAFVICVSFLSCGSRRSRLAPHLV